MKLKELEQLEVLLERFCNEEEHGLTYDSYVSIEPMKFTIAELYVAIQEIRKAKEKD